MSAAHWAFIFRPPSSTKRVRSGSAAKIAVRPSESETGLKSCVYTESLPRGSFGPIARPLHRGNSFHGARRPLRHLPRRHVVSVHRAGGGAPAGAARHGGRVPGGANLLRAAASEQRVRGRGACAGAPFG